MRRLKPATGLWKIQPQWVVTAGKQTNKQTNLENSNIIIPVSYVQCLLFRPILTKIGVYQQILVKIPNKNFHEVRPLRVAFFHTDGRRDG